MARRGRSRKRHGRALDGLLLLDKSPGKTSNQALQWCKQVFQARKAGHTGSLDPLASGMLPICFGQATKLSGYLLDADKTYRVTARVGTRTDTGDADGQVVEHSSVSELDPAALDLVLDSFRGEIQQVPPMYSALKKDGRRLYELAREGKQIEREARRVQIHELRVDTWDPVQPTFYVRCSKGTYIRTLIEDIAQAAGSLAHVASLRRLGVEPFSEERMVAMDELDRAARDGLERLDAYLLPVDAALQGWPALELDSNEAWYISQGNPVSTGPGWQAGLVRLYDPGHRFLGVGEVLLDGRVAPRRLFLPEGRGEGVNRPPGV